MWKVYVEYRIAGEKEAAFREKRSEAAALFESGIGGEIRSWELWEGTDQPGLFVEEIVCATPAAAAAVAAVQEAKEPAEGRDRPGVSPECGLTAGQWETLREWARRRGELGAVRLHVWVFERR
ncbi:MAG: hypothetical protein QJR06_05285 [Alicyclobacillaceae bacterium]|nr:hypothetical protein [Alicyclobacillaceae bacterium]